MDIVVLVTLSSVFFVRYMNVGSADGVLLTVDSKQMSLIIPRD